MTRPIQQMAYELLKEFLAMNERRNARENQIAAGINLNRNFLGNSDSNYEKKFNNDNVYEFLLSDNKDKDDQLWDEVEFLDMFEKMGVYVNEWCKLFTEEDLENCFDKVDVMNYKEELKLRHNIVLT